MNVLSEFENTHHEKEFNREEIAGDFIMALGTATVVGAGFSGLILNYSVDPTLFKVIGGGLLTFAVGGLTKLHGAYRRYHTNN